MLPKEEVACPYSSSLELASAFFLSWAGFWGHSPSFSVGANGKQVLSLGNVVGKGLRNFLFLPVTRIDTSPGHINLI